MGPNKEGFYGKISEINKLVGPNKGTAQLLGKSENVDFLEAPLDKDQFIVHTLALVFISPGYTNTK